MVSDLCLVSSILPTDSPRLMIPLEYPESTKLCSRFIFSKAQQDLITMSSIGKITSSLLSNTNELTLAAASVNFDFSLFKVEAPKEFHGVRDALSKIRREKAESGLSHITARKLGALFEPLVPPIPNLLRAYGQRVSEISSKISDDISSASSTSFGIFSSQVGPDATNIWAAATSGRGAMAVQLLACMLARIWKEPEAISLWVEIIERRRIEVNGSMDDGSNVAALMAARQTFNREQLAAWDSSARSWIMTADDQMRVQQTQLMLIISNIDMPVNSSSDLYDSVIKAWRSAMMAMEKLVQGIPQQIRDGSIMLAISSWHLYPDMAVLSDVMKRVEQNDPLLNGSLITFSVHLSPATEDSAGIFWSLPMAHMRYYSPPIVAKGRLTSDTSRVSMNEFLIVVLGVVISPWMRTLCPDPTRCCRLIRLLWKLVQKLPHGTDFPYSDWLFMLSEAVNRYLSATGILSEKYSKLLSLGIRSQSDFLGENTQQDPVFGLTSFDAILGLIRDEKVEVKIKYLRQIAQSLEPDSEGLIIKYTNDRDTGLTKDGNPSNRDVESHDVLDSFRYEYASAVPVRRNAQKRSADGAAHSGEGHRRWVLGRRTKLDHTSTRWCSDSCGCVSADGLPCMCMAFETTTCSPACHPGEIKCDNFTNYEEFPTTHKTGAACDRRCAICYNETKKFRIQDLGEDFRWCRKEDTFHSHTHFQWENAQDSGDTMVYEFVLGSKRSCGIYKSEHCRIGRKPNSPAGEYQATIDEVEAILKSPDISSDLVHVSLQRWFHQSRIGESLAAMVFASTLYRALPGATVSLEVIRIPLPIAGWPQVALKASKTDSNLSALFSCLAMFESGQFVVSPSTLCGVFAMSSYDSIFVASALMSDPCEDNAQTPIKRGLGNMGRSEMVFMIPPADPRFNEVDPRSWQLINHSPFDGQFLDSFKSTSLHLNLTEFELPIDVGARGLRDRQAVLLESVIAVNDKGMHLGDVDILSALESGLVIRAGPCIHGSNAGKHEGSSNSSRVSNKRTVQSSQDLRATFANLISLDCWDELLDPPSNSKSIFRATGNWQARLAAMAACKQKGYRVRVLPRKPCILCIAPEDEVADFDVLIA